MKQLTATPTNVGATASPTEQPTASPSAAPSPSPTMGPTYFVPENSTEPVLLQMATAFTDTKPGVEEVKPVLKQLQHELEKEREVIDGGKIPPLAMIQGGMAVLLQATVAAGANISVAADTSTTVIEVHNGIFHFCKALVHCCCWFAFPCRMCILYFGRFWQSSSILKLLSKLQVRNMYKTLRHIYFNGRAELLSTADTRKAAQQLSTQFKDIRTVSAYI
jgi:hypothetical protein